MLRRPMLLDSIRAEAKPGIWANGVNLARAGAVAVQERSGKEIVLRVRAPGRAVPWTVVLYPEDDAWECDCPSKVDPCEHSVAAAIALQQGESQAAPLPPVDGVDREKRRRTAAELFERAELTLADGRLDDALALYQLAVDNDPGNKRFAERLAQVKRK
jgi:uncharacterized Zn finger protein